MKKRSEVNFSIFLRAGSVDSGPPLSTILGNYGVNTVAFTKDFNEKTKGLPNYFLLEILVKINNDRSFDFLVKEPTVLLLVKLVSKKVEILLKGQGGLKTDYVYVVTLKELYMLTFFKFGNIEEKSLRTICASILSAGYYII